MDDVSRIREVVEGYLDLGTQLLKTWTPFVNDVAAKVDTGTFDAADAADDFPTAANLVAHSWMLIGSEAIDALAVLTKSFGEDEAVVGYRTTLAGATLAVKGDLESVTKQTLQASRVTVRPAKLAPNDTMFTLEVDGDGLKARTYDGCVVATAENGDTEEVFVSVTIG